MPATASLQPPRALPVRCTIPPTRRVQKIWSRQILVFQGLKNMKKFSRLLAILLSFTASVCTNSFAQQPDSAKPATSSAKKPVAQSPEKPAENPAKTEAAPEPKPSPHESSDGKDSKEEHYDMTEMPPVVTHHQITVDGKLLKYTASAGRLPIKRGDGKIEAEMFYVAYAL